MRIVHVADSFLPYGGEIETQIANLARRQAAGGDDVLVLTRTKGRPEADALHPFQVNRYVWLGGRGAGVVDPRAPGRFEAAIAEHKPDIVHVHLGESSPVAQRVLRRLSEGPVPTIVTVHPRWSALSVSPLFLRQAKSLESTPVLWTGSSPVVADSVADLLGQESVPVLPPGLDQAAWAAKPIPHDDLLFVADAYFTPRERILEFIDMLVVLSRKVPRMSFRAVIAGVGPILFQAERSVMWRELRRFIELPAQLSRPELVELYAGADVYVAPAAKDSAPLAPYEAQAAGLAILSRSQSGVGQQLTPQQGATGATDDEMIEIMKSWVENPAPMQAMKAHNRATPSPLDWSVTLPRVKELYALTQGRYQDFSA